MLTQHFENADATQNAYGLQFGLGLSTRSRTTLLTQHFNHIAYAAFLSGFRHGYV